MRTVAVAGALVLGAAAGLYAACQPTLDLGTNTARLDFDSNAIVVAQDGTPTQLTLRLGGDAQGAGSRLVAELPGGLNGLEYAFVHASGDAMGTVTFHVTATDGGPPPVAAGTYTVKLHVETAGTATDALPLPVTIAPVAHVQPGDGGTLREFVSTSLQPAYFQQSLPDPGALHALTSAPIHVQVFDSPWQGATERPDDSVWNFNELDRVLAPLLARGDSVELQIYAPPALTGDGVNGSFDFAAHEDVFAAYCANIVRYYNHQGLLWDGGVVQPDGGVAPFDGGTVTSSQPGTIRWWSILSDCNNNGNFPQTCPTWSQYPQVYNAAAAAMRRADPTIKLLALEANDGLSGGSQATPAGYLASFFVSPDAGGFDPSLVDSVAVHMFATTVASTAENTAPDITVMATPPQFGRHVTTIVSQLRDAGLAGAEVWVTQANVNSDFPTQSDPPSPDGTPVSGNMQSVPFVVDRRGTSAFYAAWQPYMFSQIGRSGAAALFHWGYTGGQNPDGGGVSLDTQNGEVSYADDGGTKYLSYWVDSTLARTYGRQPSAPAQTILPSWVTDGSQSVDVLATRTTDGSTLVMVSNIATTADAGAPNGPGQPRSVIVDLAPLGAGATSAWVLQVDADTSLAAGPACAPITVGVDQRVLLTFGGYGMAVLTIASAQDAGAPQSGPCASP